MAKFALNKKSKYLLAASLMAFSINAANFGVGYTAPEARNNVKEAIKILGFEKEKNFKFAKKSIKDGVATYENVTIDNDLLIDKLVFTLSPIDNNLEVRIFNLKNQTTESKFTAQEVYFHFDDKLNVNTKSSGLPLIGDGQTPIGGDIAIKGLKLDGSDKDIEINAAGLNIDDMRFDKEGLSSFSGAKMTGIEIPNDMLKINVANIEIAGINKALFKYLSKKVADDDKGGMKSIEKNEILKHLTFDKFSIEGINVLPGPMMAKIESNKAKFMGFSLGKFEILNLTNTSLGRFAIEKVLAKGVIEGQSAHFRLDEISADGLNLEMYKTIIGAYLTPKDDPEFKALQSKKLIEFYKGGPLDAGLDKYALRGLSVDGAGAQISIDQIAYNIIKNSDGIVERAEMPVGHIELKINDESKPLGALLLAGLSELDLTGIKMSFGAKSTYDVANDKGRFYDTFFRWEDFGEFKMEGSLKGQMAWLKETSIGDLLSIAKPAKLEDAKKGAPPKIDAKSLEEERNLIAAMIRKLTIEFGRLELKDLGGINRFATKEAADGNSTPAKIRAKWVADLKQDAADKKNSAFTRQMIGSLAKFVQSGGTFFIELDSPQGVEISKLLEPNAKPEALGVKVGVK